MLIQISATIMIMTSSADYATLGEMQDKQKKNHYISAQ
jgi:hypothetical protein